MLDSPLAASEGDLPQYIAFDSDPDRVMAGQKAGFKVRGYCCRSVCTCGDRSLLRMPRCGSLTSITLHGLCRQLLFGDATRGAVLRAAGVEEPRAVVVCYADKESAVMAVGTLSLEFPSTPIYACAADLRHVSLVQLWPGRPTSQNSLPLQRRPDPDGLRAGPCLCPVWLSRVVTTAAATLAGKLTHCPWLFRHAVELKEAGASQVVIRSVEAGLALGTQLLGSFGASENDLAFLRRGLESTVEARTQELATWLANTKDQVRLLE
jgi:voltage-gated potassium channel Kch